MERCTRLARLPGGIAHAGSRPPPHEVPAAAAEGDRGANAARPRKGEGPPPGADGQGDLFSVFFAAPGLEPGGDRWAPCALHHPAGPRGGLRHERTSVDFERLGAFYLGRPVEPDTGFLGPEPLLYDSRDLTTHAVCVGMT